MKKFVIFLFLVFLVGGSIFGYKYYKSDKEAVEYKPSDIAEISVGNLESVVTAQGTLEPKEYVDVGAQVSGLIKKMYFELGDFVNKSDLIAEIDPEIYESLVREDEARLKTLSAQKVEQEANIKLAKKKYDRNKKLIAANAVSKEEYEDAENALQVAQAQLLSLNAQIEEKQSALEGDKTNLGYTKIYSPMTGTIVEQSVNEGQTINANQTAPVIVQVAQLDVMTVKAEVAEADIMKIKTGTDMYFTTLGSNERRWWGKVRQVLPSPQTENDVVLYNVLVDVDNKDNQLMVGMTAQMFFVLSKVENVPLIPKTALVKRLSGKDTEAGQAYMVKVLKQDGTVEDRTVIVGVSDRVNASSVSGLSAGEKVLVGDAAQNHVKGKMMPPPGMGRL